MPHPTPGRKEIVDMSGYVAWRQPRCRWLVPGRDAMDKPLADLSGNRQTTKERANAPVREFWEEHPHLLPDLTRRGEARDIKISHRKTSVTLASAAAKDEDWEPTSATQRWRIRLPKEGAAGGHGRSADPLAVSASATLSAAELRALREAMAASEAASSGAGAGEAASTGAAAGEEEAAAAAARAAQEEEEAAAAQAAAERDGGSQAGGVPADDTDQYGYPHGYGYSPRDPGVLYQSTVGGGGGGGGVYGTPREHPSHPQRGPGVPTGYYPPYYQPRDVREALPTRLYGECIGHWRLSANGAGRNNSQARPC